MTDFSILHSFQACIQNLHNPRCCAGDVPKYKYYQLIECLFQTVRNHTFLGQNLVAKYSLDCLHWWGSVQNQNSGPLIQRPGKIY